MKHWNIFLYNSTVGGGLLRIFKSLQQIALKDSEPLTFIANRFLYAFN